MINPAVVEGQVRRYRPGQGALVQHAEATYAGLPTDEHRSLTRALFLRLVDPGAPDQDPTRRRAALSELVLALHTAVLNGTYDDFCQQHSRLVA